MKEKKNYNRATMELQQRVQKNWAIGKLLKPLQLKRQGIQLAVCFFSWIVMPHSWSINADIFNIRNYTPLKPKLDTLKKKSNYFFLRVPVNERHIWLSNMTEVLLSSLQEHAGTRSNM
jgi:hypothetical protein